MVFLGECLSHIWRGVALLKVKTYYRYVCVCVHFFCPFVILTSEDVLASIYVVLLYNEISVSTLIW